MPGFPSSCAYHKEPHLHHLFSRAGNRAARGLSRHSTHRHVHQTHPKGQNQEDALRWARTLAVLSCTSWCQLAGSTISHPATFLHHSASLFFFFSYFSFTLAFLHDSSVSCYGLQFNKSNQIRMQICTSCNILVLLLSHRVQHLMRNLLQFYEQYIFKSCSFSSTSFSGHHC